MQKGHGPLRRWHGSKALIFDAIEETTNLVERMHRSAANRSMRPLTGSGPLVMSARAVHSAHATTATTVYAAVRHTSRGVETLLNAGTGSVAGFESIVDNIDGQINRDTPQRSDATNSRSWYLDHAEAHINGLYGDFLERQRNPLDLGMTLRVDGQVLPVCRTSLEQVLPNANGRLCIFVHGLSSTEWSWSIAAEEFHGDASASFGTKLRDELGYTPLYVRYNSGRHISDNGQSLSILLADLVSVYPCEVDELVLVGHSMGGLVARSAATCGQQKGEAWVDKLRAVVCIGSPTLGAPLEQAVGLVGGLLSAVDLVGTQVPAQLLKSRSAGIKDLRHGYTVPEEWRERDQDDPLANHRRSVPLVDGVGYYFIAATATQDPGHPVGLFFGDLLVRLPSAKGQAARPERCVAFDAGHVLNGINHFHLANHPDVYAMIREVLTT